MAKSVFLTGIILFFIPSVVFSQLAGVVKDSNTGRIIERAEVFINETSIYDLTNSEGAFALSGIAPGFADLVVFKEGYEVFKSSVRILPDRQFKLNLMLTPAEKVKYPKTKMDSDFKINQEWFQRALFGNTPNAAQVSIANPKALVFKNDAIGLVVNFTEPLIIENRALGYKIHGYFQTAEVGADNAIIGGWVRFDTLSPKTSTDRETWQRNRMVAYWGSLRHLFRSIVMKQAAENGYEIYGQDEMSLHGDSLVEPSKMEGYFKINLPARVKVKYNHETPQLAMNKAENSQTSWIEPVGNVEVSIDGILFNTQTVKVSGAMAAHKLADQLPLNFVPSSSLQEESTDWKNFELLQEKVYLHTDRDYYYPRENVWFKAYMGVSMPSLRDTLSKTLYVELIGPDKSIVKARTLRIKEGVAWGDFKLADTLSAGNYYLRAYTNWMRNYGEETFFIKQIPVLNYNENIALEAAVESGGSPNIEVAIKPSAPSYKARENVELAIRVGDAQGRPLSNANLSISVTDAFAVVPIDSISIVAKGILTPDRIAGKRKSYFESIQFAMEKGLSMTGTVKDGKGAPGNCSLQIVQGNLENMIVMETDDQGRFALVGLEFYDSTLFAFKASKKNKVYSTIALDNRTPAPFTVNFKSKPLSYRSENALQRIQNTYNPEENVTLLSEVEVRGKKIDEQARKGNIKVYGKADYTLKGNNIRSTAVGTNFLVGLQGKVPGLRVTETVGPNGTPQVSVKIRGGSSSLVGDTNPLFLVDGVPFPDANSLSALSPDMIDSVEIITRAVPQFGSRGTNGVISIFTKKGITAETDRPDFVGQKVLGYSRPRPFTSPSYLNNDSEEPDFRTTIYWNPNVVTDSAGEAFVSFYTADLEGKYRIIIEGLTSDGNPVRSESFIEVK